MLVNQKSKNFTTSSSPKMVMSCLLSTTMHCKFKMAASIRQFCQKLSQHKTSASLFYWPSRCTPMTVSKMCVFCKRPVFIKLSRGDSTPNNITSKTESIMSQPRTRRMPNQLCKLTLNYKTKLIFHTRNLLTYSLYRHEWWYEEATKNAKKRFRSEGVLAMGILSFFFPKKDDDITIENTIASAIHQERKGNIHEAEKQLHQALEMSLKQNNQQGVTYIYDQLANLHMRHGNLEQAEASFKETLRRLLSSGTEKNDPAVIEISLKLAEIYSATKRVSEAQQGFRWCLETTEEIIKDADKDSTTDNTYQSSELTALLGMCLEAYARFLSRYKQYNEAEKMYMRALAICENELMINGQPHIESVTILSDLGTLYDLKGEHNKAKEHLRRAANLAQRLGDEETMPTILCNLASLEDHLGNRREAMRLFKKALIQAESQGDAQSILIIKNKIAQLETDILLQKKS